MVNATHASLLCKPSLLAPPKVAVDPLFGLAEEFGAYPGTQKVNLGLGIYLNSEGQAAPFPTVEQIGLDLEAASKPARYLPILGDPTFRDAALAFYMGHEKNTPHAPVSVQTLGGTGALALAGRLVMGQAITLPKVWISDPSWANHASIFGSLGLQVERYPYLNRATMSLHRDALFACLSTLGPQDVVLLQACGHNPTGLDLNEDDWRTVAEICAARGWLPLFDIAYAGLCRGLAEDLRGPRYFLSRGLPTVAALSFSKIMGLYAERVGALLVFGAPRRERVVRWLEREVRTLYSNPPRFGALVAGEVPRTETVQAQWKGELTRARQRVLVMRHALSDRLAAAQGRSHDRFRAPGGLFSLSGLTPEQVETAKQEGVFVPGSGRINFGALTHDNVAFVARALITAKDP